MKMKNLFDYATSELSQDAFLCWLFENYDCENEIIRSASLDLLRIMTGIEDLQNDSYFSLKTERQVEHTDVIVIFTHKGEKHILLVEDKVFSDFHKKQLEYKRKIAQNKEIDEDHIHCVLYKTDLENKGERNLVEESGWKAFYIRKIDAFFSGYNGSDCLIFDQYRTHISERVKSLDDRISIPMNEWKEHGDKLLFRAFILNDLFPLVEKLQNNSLEQPEMKGWHSYASLYLTRKHNYDQFVLTMEIAFHPNWNGANITIRCWGETEVPKDLKMQLQSFLIAKYPFFKKYNSEKWCIATGQDILLYADGMDVMTKEIEKRIQAFVDLCNKANEELSNHPEWQKLFVKKEDIPTDPTSE